MKTRALKGALVWVCLVVGSLALPEAWWPWVTLGATIWLVWYVVRRGQRTPPAAATNRPPAWMGAARDDPAGSEDR